MNRKSGDIAIPRNFPVLQGKITNIAKDLDGETPLYILDNGGRYTESELEPTET